jgi:hypothetical protein
LSPLSVQTAAPVVQTTEPVRQGLVGEHALPAAQAAHAPLLQTMFVAQTVPFACAVWVSMHDATPLAEQIVCPTWHALVGVQAPPGVHAGTSVPPSGEPAPPRPPAPAVPPVPAPPRPPAPALPPAPPITEPPVPPPPPRPAVAIVPPRPPTPTVPPAPAVPTPPSGNIGSTRRPHARFAHPHRTDTHTSRLNIMSPVLRTEGCSRDPASRDPEYR